MNIKSILGTDAFWMVNKAIAKHLQSIESALLLAYLIDKDDYHRVKGEVLNIDGYDFFYATSNKIEEATTLSYRKQKKTIKLLEKAGFIMTVLTGVPAKLHFAICKDKILQTLKTSISETRKLDLAKRENILKIDNKEKTNNNTVEKTKFSDDVCSIIDFLNDQTNSRYKPDTNKTKDCIKARMNEGFVVDEFKTVINHQAKKWLGTDQEQYLRPETLFGNKFEGYLNDAIRKRKTEKHNGGGGISLKKLQRI